MTATQKGPPMPKRRKTKAKTRRIRKGHILAFLFGAWLL